MLTLFVMLNWIQYWSLRIAFTFRMPRQFLSHFDRLLDVPDDTMYLSNNKVFNHCLPSIFILHGD
ncbi:hypothetical protein CXB77_08870 [Chromatium okenii]|uniref:Uncharacterized protein n=1 Tax=Chromatium okenii TaxID=61644 RepID=A0A2S7XQG4_9GAMM|nr:hypothetical protein CXB77_08870 [Chromatium okenii]